MEQIVANESLNGWEGFFVEVIALLRKTMGWPITTIQIMLWKGWKWL